MELFENKQTQYYEENDSKKIGDWFRVTIWFPEYLENTCISFSSSKTQFYESQIFCLFTFWGFFPDKSFKLMSKCTQKCQYNLLFQKENTLQHLKLEKLKSRIYKIGCLMSWTKYCLGKKIWMFKCDFKMTLSPLCHVSWLAFLKSWAEKIMKSCSWMIEFGELPH